MLGNNARKFLTAFFFLLPDTVVDRMRKRRDCASGRPDINRIFFNGLAVERIMAVPNVSQHLGSDVKGLRLMDKHDRVAIKSRTLRRNAAESVVAERA